MKLDVKTLYLDSSAIIEIFERTRNARQLESVLRSEGAHVLLSEETFFEIAHPGLFGKLKIQRKSTIEQLLSLPYRLVRKRGEIILRELLSLKGYVGHQTSNIFFLEQRLLLETAKHALDLKPSDFRKPNRLVSIFRERNKKINVSNAWYNEMKVINSDEQIGGINFTELIDQPDYALLQAALGREELSWDDFEKFVKARTQYPIIEATLRAYCYLLTKLPQKNTRKDLVKDTAHLISAAQSDLFITCDSKQYKEAQVIIPSVKAIRWKSISS